MSSWRAAESTAAERTICSTTAFTPFTSKKNARVKYIEKHYGEGDGNGKRVLNPETVIYLAEGAYMEMEATQIKGVDSTVRVTKAKVGDNAKLVIHEKIMTHGNQLANRLYRGSGRRKFGGQRRVALGGKG